MADPTTTTTTTNNHPTTPKKNSSVTTKNHHLHPSTPNHHYHPNPNHHPNNNNNHDHPPPPPTQSLGKRGPLPPFLPPWARFYFYGMHGLLDEVLFTAVFDLLFHAEGNPQLKGYTTLCSFFIYGSCCFAMERCFVYGTRYGYPMLVRVAVYVFFAYLWEFSCGLLLRQFDACSWDYSHYPLNLMGLVTLIYAPGWFALGIGQDYIYRYLFSLRHVTHESSVQKLD